MRFLLLENVPQITNEMVALWKAGDQAIRDILVDHIIQQYSHKELENIKSSIRKSFYAYGIDTNTNPFIAFFDTLAKTNNITKEYNALVSVMIDLTERRDIKVDIKSRSAGYLTHPSLWNRNVEDFTYTLRAFDVVQDKNKLKKYFKRIDGIDISGFMLPDGSIKPAGSEATADDMDTIYGTIEFWSNKGKNDKESGSEITRNGKQSGQRSQ